MTFIKQSEVPECGCRLMERLRAGTVGWVSENRCYLITLFNANRSSSRLVDKGYNKGSDYVRMCALKPDGDMHRMVARMRCPQDGTAAFVINELMRITDEHGYPDEHIRDFTRRIGVGMTLVSEGEDGVSIFHDPQWERVTLRAFQEYKERQKSEV